jgi:hypothetical protein
VGRLKVVWVVAALAVVVSVVAAGSAAAAKGGNSENAHACQQGGHENRFEAETGKPFKNAGACARHRAQGGATSSLQILTVPTYPCSDSPGTCWGIISGSGLDAGAQWQAFIVGPGLIVASGVPDASGNLEPTALEVPCGQAGTDPVQAVALTSADPPVDITSAEVQSPCG